MTTILAVDPGTEKSGWVLYDATERRPLQWGWEPNEDVEDRAENHGNQHLDSQCLPLAVEWVSNHGMAVGQDVFWTVYWIGRFSRAYSGSTVNPKLLLIPRSEIKLHICGQQRAKDGNVRQALIDRWGGDAKAIGGRKCKGCKGKGWFGRRHYVCQLCDGSGYESPPGPLYGISSHVWQALALAVTASHRLEGGGNA
jgi:hypothetical protein